MGVRSPITAGGTTAVRIIRGEATQMPEEPLSPSGSGADCLLSECRVLSLSFSGRCIADDWVNADDAARLHPVGGIKSRTQEWLVSLGRPS